MIKYMEMSELNSDQIKVIKEKGWCVFTECDQGGSYYTKGFAWVNRIGYVIFSEDVEKENLDSHSELNEIASYDEKFDKEVRNALAPLKDKCYVFLVKDPANYHFEQVWTNKGLAKAKKLANLRFRFEHKYYSSKDYAKMEEIINKHNHKVNEDTKKAIELLKENGFSVVSANFAVIQLTT